MSDRDSNDPEDGGSETRSLRRRSVLGGVFGSLVGAALPGSTVAQSDEPLPNEITIVSRSNPVRYRIEVSGRIEAGEEAGENERFEDGAVVGLIDGADAPDNFLFSGVITHFELLEGEADVFLNGVEVTDPARFFGPGAGGSPVPPDGGELPNELALVSRSNSVRYRIEVSGRIEAGDEAGENDEVEDGAVDGLIDGPEGRDDYHFSGVITHLELLEGEADVFLNGVDVTPLSVEPELPRLLVVRSLSDVATYEVDAEGDLEFGASAGGNDERADGTVLGTLDGAGALDSYLFSGSELTIEVTDGAVEFVVGGAAEVVPDSDGPLPHEVRVTGLGDLSDYSLSVTGTVEKGPRAEDEATDVPADEVVDGRRVDGYVQAQDGDPRADDYRFSGKLHVERAQAPVRVIVTFDRGRSDETTEESSESDGTGLFGETGLFGG